MVVVNADNMRYDDLLGMPETLARLRDRGVSFLSHRAELSACAPDRAALFTGLYHQNHKLSSTNSTTEYYNYCVDGKLVAGRWYGPWEKEVASRGGGDDPQLSSGSLPNWLRNPVDSAGMPLAGARRVWTAAGGKWQNAYADPFGGRPAADTHLRVPPGWDSWFCITGDETGTYNGGVDDEHHTRLCVGSNPGTTYAAGSEEYYEYEQPIVSGSRTGGIATVTIGVAHHLVVGDIVVISGCTPSAYNGTWTVIAVPSSTQFQFALSGSDSITTPGTAYVSSLHQCGILLWKAKEFLDARGPSDSWFLYLAPHPPSEDSGNADNREQQFIGTVSPADFVRYGGTAGAVPPTMQPRVVSYTWNGSVTTVVTQTAHSLTTGTQVALHGLDGHSSCQPPWTGTPGTSYLAVTVVDATTFTVAAQFSPQASGGAGGMVITRTRRETWQYRQELLKSLDRLVARLDQHLEAKGWSGTTIFVFTSDNGYMHQEHGRSVWGINAYSWEEAVRLPFLVRHPQLPAATTRVEPTMVLDVPLTILDWFGLTNHYAHTKRDGVSVMRLIDPANQYRSRTVLVDNSNAAAIDSTNRKGYNDATGLYLLLDDPIEQTDVAATYPAVLATLQAKITALRSCQGETCRTA